MLDDPMTKEAWGLAATILAQDGLRAPVLLLWRESDDAVKLTRLETCHTNPDFARDLEHSVAGFEFDHAILISRAMVGLATPFGEASLQRHGVCLRYLSRDGDGCSQFSEIMESEGVFQLSEPAPLPEVGTALDILFRPGSPTH